MERLTEKQDKVLNFIKRYLDLRGYAPSVRDVAEGLRMNPYGALKHLKILERKGYIRRSKDTARGIEIVGYSTRDTRNVPLVGRISAGPPIYAVEDIEGVIPIPKKLVKEEDAFLLRVQGDSMNKAGIDDGDYVLVRVQPVAENEDIVVVLIDDEVTLKRFHLERNIMRLVPESSNPDNKTIVVRNGEADVRIIGIAVATIKVLRKDTSLL